MVNYNIKWDRTYKEENNREEKKERIIIFPNFFIDTDNRFKLEFLTEGFDKTIDKSNQLKNVVLNKTAFTCRLNDDTIETKIGQDNTYLFEDFNERPKIGDTISVLLDKYNIYTFLSDLFVYESQTQVSLKSDEDMIIFTVENNTQPLFDTDVYINYEKYTTDNNGHIYLDKSNLTKYIINIYSTHNENGYITGLKKIFTLNGG